MYVCIYIFENGEMEDNQFVCLINLFGYSK